MPFTIPNYSATNYPLTARHGQHDSEALGRVGTYGVAPRAYVWNGSGIGVAPQIGPFAGVLLLYGGFTIINGRRVIVPSQAVTVTPDGTNPRWINVEVDSQGKIQHVLGTPHATDPVPPVQTAGRLLVASMLVLTTDTSATLAAALGTANNRVIDKTVHMPYPLVSPQKPIHRVAACTVPAGQTTPLGNFYGYNSAPHTGPNLWTKWADNFRGTNQGAYLQFFVFVGPDRQPYISRRVLPYGDWSTPTNLKTVLGNVDVENDEHNAFSVAVSDTDGLIHVTGNHHGDALRYCTGNRYDTATWSSVTWTNRANQVAAADEDAVVYPRFFRRPDGALCLLYTNQEDPVLVTWGRRAFLNRYTPGGTPGTYGSWSRLSSPISGAYGDPASVENQRVYYYPPAIDYARNRIWLFWMWRWAESTSGIEHNWGLYVICSEDGGSTWKSFPAGSGGTLGAQTVPVTTSNAPAMVVATPGQPTAPGNTTTTQLNGGSACVDAYGRPHLFFQRYVSGTYPSGQWGIFHIWYDDRSGSWARGYRQIANTNIYSRGALVPTADGDVLYVDTASWSGHGDTREAMLMTPESPEYVQTASGDITPDASTHVDAAYGAWSPARTVIARGLDERSIAVTYDPEAVRLLNEFHSLWTSAADEGQAAHQAQTSYFYNPANWQQWGFTNAIDLDQVGALFAGAHSPPTVEKIATIGTWPLDTAVAAGTIAALPAVTGNTQSYFRMEADDFNQKWVVARVRGRAQVSASGTTLVVQIREIADDGSTGVLGYLSWGDPLSSYAANDIGAYVTKQTPWMPLQVLAQFRASGAAAKDGRLDLGAFKTGAGTATIQGGSLQLEVGVINMAWDE